MCLCECAYCSAQVVRSDFAARGCSTSVLPIKRKWVWGCGRCKKERREIGKGCKTLRDRRWRVQERGSCWGDKSTPSVLGEEYRGWTEIAVLLTLAWWWFSLVNKRAPSLVPLKLSTEAVNTVTCSSLTYTHTHTIVTVPQFATACKAYTLCTTCIIEINLSLQK